MLIEPSDWKITRLFRSRDCMHIPVRTFGIALIASLGLFPAAGCRYRTAANVDYHLYHDGSVAADSTPPKLAQREDSEVDSSRVPPAPAVESRPIPTNPNTGDDSPGPRLQDQKPRDSQPLDVSAPKFPPAQSLDQKLALLVVGMPTRQQPLQTVSAQRTRLAAAQSNRSESNGTQSQQKRFSIPRQLPGADAEPLKVPRLDPTAPAAERSRQIRALYRPLAALPAEQVPPSDGSHELTLTELQQLAFDNNPVLRQAAAAVERTRGLAIQAGAYPNPEVGYQADTANTGQTSGYQGGFIAQTIVTADKLSYQQSAAVMEQRVAELELRKTRIELASDVRKAYFDVLIAVETVRLTRALFELADRAYEAQIELVEGLEAAPYEPLQLRVFAQQMHNSVLRAENDYQAAWRSLAAALGLPNLPPAPLHGSAEMLAPQVDYQRALAFLESHHTDLASVASRIQQSGFDLRLQEVTPVPNINLQTSIFHDDTSPLNDAAYSLQIGLPLPVFNRNRGNIIAAEANVIRNQQDWLRARNQLTSQLARSYGRYASATRIVQSYQSDVLPDQMRTYRGIYNRFVQVGDGVDFAQVILAQQTLFTAMQDYVQALSEQWDSAVELARIAQIDDLFGMESLIGPAANTEPAPVE